MATLDGTRVLVTGGAGFIGSHTVDALVEGGSDVVVLDSLRPDRHDGPPEHLNRRATYDHGDVTDGDAWRRAARGADAICHLAGQVGLGVDFADVCDYVHHNDTGAAVGLLALHEIGFRGRFVLASSMVVYGEGAYRCPEHGSVRAGPRRRADLDAGRFEPPCPTCGAPLEPEMVTEDAPLDPRNVYAATKAHQEHLAAAFGREHGVAVTALRYHNVYGPRMPKDTPYAGVAAVFASELGAGRAPMVYEDGRQTRDFVHVRDAAAANVVALTRDEPVSGAFNVASGQPRTVGELAEVMADAFGAGAPRPRVVGGARSGDVRHVFASPARAHDVLGFTAAVPFAQGVSDLVTNLTARR